MYAIGIEPHDDDLVIGAGGILEQLIQSGAEVDSIQVTDGRYGDQEDVLGLTPEELVERRKREKRLESEYTGIDVKFLDFEDGSLDEMIDDGGVREGSEMAEEVRRLAEYMSETQPDAVFIPRQDEDHPDHRATYTFVQDILEETDAEPVEFHYEVWQLPFHEANPGEINSRIAVDVSDVYDRKMNAIKIHQSQDYPNPEDQIPLEQIENASTEELDDVLQDYPGMFSKFVRDRDRDYANRIGMLGDSYDMVELLGSPASYDEVDEVLPEPLNYEKFGEVNHGSSEADIS